MYSQSIHEKSVFYEKIERDITFAFKDLLETVKTFPFLYFMFTLTWCNNNWNGSSIECWHVRPSCLEWTYRLKMSPKRMYIKVNFRKFPEICYFSITSVGTYFNPFNIL